MIFEARQPTALTLCEAYFNIYPLKICNLRPDSLGLLLTMANVNANSRVLFVENTKGFIAGCLVEKRVDYALRVEFNAGVSLKVPTDVLQMFNFDRFSLRRIGSVH